MKTCIKCNTINDDNVAFCKSCGNSFSSNKSDMTWKKQQFNKFSFPTNTKKIGILAIILVFFIFVVFSIKSSWDSKKVLELEYLQALYIEDSALENDMRKLNDDNINTKDVDVLLDKVGNYIEKYVLVTNSFAKYTEGISLENPDNLKEFVEKKELIDKIMPNHSACDITSATLHLTSVKSINLKQKTRFMEFIEKQCKASEPLREIIVIKDVKKVEWIFKEQTSKDIPVGYSIITLEPIAGEEWSVSVTINGVEKGSGNIVVKEPIDGIKMTGIGKTEDIAKQVDLILQEIITLWHNQKFSANDVLPYLDEANKNKASDWEWFYNKIIFNWIRLDNVKSLTSQIEFKDNVYDKNYPIVAYLPYKDKYFAGYWETKISFYYDAKANKWVSTNTTITELFNDVLSQKVPAEVSPNKFQYVKDDLCIGVLNYHIEDVEISDANIIGYNQFRYNLQKGRAESSFLTVDGFKDSMEHAYSNSNLPTDMISYINKEKKNQLIANKFSYNNGNCKSNIVVKYTFFKDEVKDTVKDKQSNEEKKDNSTGAVIDKLK